MFYLVEVEDHVRVEPKHFGLPTREAIEKQLNESYVDTVHKEIGFVISVVSVDDAIDGHLLVMKKGRSGENYIIANEFIPYDPGDFIPSLYPFPGCIFLSASFLYNE